MILVALLTALGMPEHAAQKCVIAVAPVGDARGAALAALVPGLRSTFHCEILIAPPVPLPSSTYDPTRQQYLSTAILDALARVKRSEWERVLGITDVDLYVPQLNFVFGEGDARRGVAVFSLARLRPERYGGKPSESLFRKRAATEAIHELGHTYGLGHCARSDCVMWFSNTLAESDLKGTEFCPIHAAELAKARRQ